MTYEPRFIAAIHMTSVNRVLIATQVAPADGKVNAYRAAYLKADGQWSDHTPPRFFTSRFALDTFIDKEAALDAAA
jgi:hypothetical protein